MLGEPKSIGPSIVSWGCHLVLPGGHANMFTVIAWGTYNKLSWSASSSHFTLLLQSGPRNFAHITLTKWVFHEAFVGKEVNLSTPVYSDTVSYNKSLMSVHLQMIPPLFHILLFVYYYFFPVMLT